MTQIPDTQPQKSAIASVAEIEAALNRAFAPQVADEIKRSLIAAMQTVVNEVDDE